MSGQLRTWTLELLRANAHRETIHFRILAYINGPVVEQLQNHYIAIVENRVKRVPGWVTAV